MPTYHDSHVHLDMLLEKLGIISAIRDKSSFVGIYENSEKLNEIRMMVDGLLQNHDFVWHSTVSFENLLMVWYLFGNNHKIWYLFGSHPEIVKDGFDLDRYIKDQDRVWRQIKNQEATTLYGLKIDTQGLYQKIVGIGEVGLDYYYTQDPDLIKLQKQLFEEQIKLGTQSLF